MMKKFFPIFLLFLLITTPVLAKRIENVEIFDITQGKVVKTAESSATVQKEVKYYLTHLTGVFGKINPLPARGYMIKIPLEPSVRVENQWLNASVDEVILLCPEGQKPYLLVFGNDNRTYFFTFEGNTEKLLKRLKYTK